MRALSVVSRRTLSNLTTRWRDCHDLALITATARRMLGAIGGHRAGTSDLANGSPTRKLNFINTHEDLLTPDGLPQPAPLRADGLHFNAAGHKVWVCLVKPRILALAAMDGVTCLDTSATPTPPQCSARRTL